MTSKNIPVGTIVKYQFRGHSWDGCIGTFLGKNPNGLARVLFHIYNKDFMRITPSWMNSELTCSIENLIEIEVDVGDLEDDF